MNVAFIPVRGGSKSIPLKNIKKICGKPLVYWTAKAACLCGYIDKVYVATESKSIYNTIEEFKQEECDLFCKLSVIGRTAESASDTASTEFAMLEFAQSHEFDNIALIQATSPLLSADDLNNGFEIFNTDETDSVLSVVRQKRFNWGQDENGFVHPTNYDVYNRPRRQEFDGYYVENGAFYITSRALLMSSKNRISGRIKAVEMDEASFFEIDEPSDWTVIESLMTSKGMIKNIIKNDIKMFLTDCDGCLTDGGMYYSEKGDEMKKFNTRDGMGFALLHNHGIMTGIITSENVDLNRRRAEKLKLDILKSGCRDKLKVVQELCEQYKITLNNVAYIGDDINDIELLDAVGFACCPADAMSVVREKVDYVSIKRGGDGAIRDIAEIVIKNIKKLD